MLSFVIYQIFPCCWVSGADFAHEARRRRSLNGLRNRVHPTSPVLVKSVKDEPVACSESGKLEEQAESATKHKRSARKNGAGRGEAASFHPTPSSIINQREIRDYRYGMSHICPYIYTNIALCMPYRGYHKGIFLLQDGKNRVNSWPDFFIVITECHYL
jgi:hypothetical protein